MIYSFGEYELDTDCHELRRVGQPLPIEPKVFDLLAYLIEHQERTVAKEDLFEYLWPDQFVSESSLTYCIAAGRKAIGDSGRAQRLIKTIHGRGYRFITPVEQYQPEDVAAMTPPSSDDAAPWVE